MKKSPQLTGMWYVIAAYTLWGFLPVYWKALQQISPSQILAHRIFWSFVFVALLLSAQRRWQEFKQAFSLRKNRRVCLLTAIVIGSNWFVYIWAVNNNHIVDASLGYFINPLISVLLGVIFLRERLNFWQVLAVMLAFVGISFLTIQYGKIPWIALYLAVTFGFYGLLRKTAQVETLFGLTAETGLLFPIVLCYLVILGLNKSGVFGVAPVSVHLLLVGAGVVTATPLLWFTAGVRKISLSTAGFLQYIAPTIQLILGVAVYSEPFTTTHLISFSFIWLALILYSLSRTPFLIYLVPRLITKSDSPQK
jgi:chloramphenicol-sensitive protein RarD